MPRLITKLIRQHHIKENIPASGDTFVQQVHMSATSNSKDQPKEVVTTGSDKTRECLQQLKERISADDYLSGRCADDEFLLKFLRVREFDVNAALTLITGYFMMRKDHPEFFREPSQVVNVLQDNVFSISFEKNSKGGELILIFRPGNWDTAKYDAYHIAAAPVPFLEIGALDPCVQSAGILEVLDFANVTWKQFVSMPVSLHKLSADLSERAMPIKYKKIHVVNQGRLVDMLWTLMKPFVSEETKQKLIFHGSDYSKLKDEIDDSMLPGDLGGTRTDTMPHDADLVKQLDGKIKDLWEKYSP